MTGTQLTPAYWFGQRSFSVESPAHRAETSLGASISSLPTTKSKGKTVLKTIQLNCSVRLWEDSQLNMPQGERVLWSFTHSTTASRLHTLLQALGCKDVLQDSQEDISLAIA